MTEFLIGKTKVGGNSPVFIVAEIGINHDGKYEQAIALIDSAKKAGCDAVKFQLFTAEEMYAEKAGNFETADGTKRDIVKIVKDGELNPEWISGLKKYSEDLGIEFFSSTCDEKSTDILENFGVSAFKIPSPELTHIPLLKHTAKKGRPVIISSANAKLFEVAEAVDAILSGGNRKIGLMHCLGKYDTPLGGLNLNVIKTFQLAFPDAVIGFSDHSSDPMIAPAAAVALGAKIIEKHITLNRKLPGPDHLFALEPQELSSMVKAIRETEKKIEEGEKIDIDLKLLGSSKRETYEIEKTNRDFVYRCLFAKENIKKGDLFTKDNLAVLRPGESKKGLEPKHYEMLIKRYRATNNIEKNSPVTWDDILFK